MPRVNRDLNWAKNAFGRDWRPIFSIHSSSIFPVLGPKEGGNCDKSGVPSRISLASEKQNWKASESMYINGFLARWMMVVFVWQGNESFSIPEMALSWSIILFTLHGISPGTSTNPALILTNWTYGRPSDLRKQLQKKMASSSTASRLSLLMSNMMWENSDTAISMNPRSCPLVYKIWFDDNNRSKSKKEPIYYGNGLLVINSEISLPNLWVICRFWKEKHKKTKSSTKGTCEMLLKIRSTEIWIKLPMYCKTFARCTCISTS